MIMNTKALQLLALSPAPSSDAPSHRWIVHLLAEMIHYAEENELPEVVTPLITAIEQVSPALISCDGPANRPERRPKNKAVPDTTNVVPFHTPRI
jgi:hypothetical protein